MRSARAIAFVLLSGLLAGPATAQLSPLAHEVAMFAPQLETFAGSRENFEALVNGLRAGGKVTLASTSADGVREIVVFTPRDPLPAMETAQLLERARNLLIARGVAAPGAKEIGVALMGGTLDAPGGPVTLGALVTPQDPKAPPLSVARKPYAGSAANYKNLVEGLAAGGQVKLATPGRPDTVFGVPGGALSADETALALRRANELLARQGIHDPSPEQLRAALVGGTVLTPDKRSVLLHGVLEGRAAPVSASPAGHTSDSKATGHTSDSKSTGHTSDSKATGHTSDSKATGHTSDSRGSGHTSDTPVQNKPFTTPPGKK